MSRNDESVSMEDEIPNRASPQNSISDASFRQKRMQKKETK